MPFAAHQKNAGAKSKKIKKKKTHKDDETSKGSRRDSQSEASVKYPVKEQTGAEPEREPAPEAKNPVEFSPYVPVSCPLCTKDDCLLNRASKCPLLQPKVSDDDQCSFCFPNCACRVNGPTYPVSGLVPRDENGVAVSLLAVNGGPIADSYSYVNRERWVVPDGVPWNHQVDVWISAYQMEQDISKDLKERNNFRKKSKSKLSHRRSRYRSLASIDQDPMFDSPNAPFPETRETTVLTEGDGFKIVMTGNEKLLVNFSEKNCRHLNCGCAKPTGDQARCGCDEGEGTASGKLITEPHKRRKSRTSKIGKAIVVRGSVTKEMSPEDIKDQTGDFDRTKNDEANDKGEIRRRLTAQAILHKSQQDFLESSLKDMLGDDYKRKEQKPDQAVPTVVTSSPNLNAPEHSLSASIITTCQCSHDQPRLNNMYCGVD